MRFHVTLHCVSMESDVMSEDIRRKKADSSGVASSKAITFRLGPDRDAAIRKLADEQHVTVARLVSEFVDEGLSARRNREHQERLAERLETAIRRIEAQPLGLRQRSAFRSEVVLVAVAVSGSQKAAPIVKYLSPDVFEFAFHQVAWRLLQALPNDQANIVAVKHSVESHLGSEYLHPDFSTDPICDLVRVSEYFDYLQLAAPRVDQHLERAAIATFHASLMRTWSDHTVALSSEELLAELRRLEAFQTSETYGVELPWLEEFGHDTNQYS